MVNHRFIFVFLLILNQLENALAQMPPAQTDSVAAKMSLLPLKEGEWSGRGWIRMGKEKHEFDQHEKISLLLDGTVLMIEGTGTENGKVIHKALAVLSYNPASKNYSFRTFKDGYTADATCALGADGVFTWLMENPRGTTRYRSKLVNGQWSETGDFSPDKGKTWHPFFEMTLSKKADK
jgi:hypothetical protein